jgi:hypothetical protein
MTYNQKYIYEQLLKGAFIVGTPTGKRSYTLYDNEIRPLKRITSNQFFSLKKVYNTDNNLITKSNQWENNLWWQIDKTVVLSLRKNTWLYKKAKESI